MSHAAPPDVAARPPAAAPAKLPGIVWATGWVSFLTDMSTEMIYGILPAFYAAALHLNVAIMGLIEGAAETIAALTKLFSGHWSDRTGRRKWWMVVGYALSTVSKPLLVLAGAPTAALALRGADRLGKGIRGAPRDSLLSREITAQQRGRAFGVQRAMDHAGALSGGVLASALLFLGWVTTEELFYWTLLPGGLAVLVILLFIRERDPRGTGHAPAVPRRSLIQAWRHESPAMKRYLLVLGIFALGNSTDMLLLVLARQRMIEAGVSADHATAALPLLWGWLHVVKSIASPWGGRLSDRTGRALPVTLGWLVYAGVYAGFAFWTGGIAPWVLFAVYGLYYGLVEGPERALVADLCADPDRRGMSYGLFHFMTGLAALPASLICGALWWKFGAAPAFLTGAALALAAAALLPWALRAAPSRERAQ